MKKIMVVEDSKPVSEYLKNRIEKNLHIKCLTASTKAECEQLLLLYKNNFEVALIDLVSK